MKSIQKNLMPLFAVLFIAALTVLTSCRKDPEEVIELLTESEAAEIIEDAVANRTAGFTLPTVDAAQIVETYLNSCNTPGDTSLQKSKSTGAATYNYSFAMDWLVICSDLNVPQTANVGIEGAGTFGSPHWTGTDVTAGDLTFTGLSPQDASYVVNGTYDLTGNLTGSLRRVTPSFDCTVALVLNNLTLDKNTYKITGGTGTAVVTASTANGQSKTLNGALEFNGNGSVTVEINGHVHTFQWQ
ncbi:MAG: hypothetical protein SFV22_11935 [Saprospiraceae bacterium]|nr:hypothetical protein [Saprospiraceae bacterium]